MVCLDQPECARSRDGEGAFGLHFTPNPLSLKPHQIPQFTPKSIELVEATTAF